MPLLRRKFAISLIAAFFAVAIGFGVVTWKMKLPKPQIASAAGQPAPDFTLADQSGQLFHLADQRGHRALLIFYRGYW